jgi:ABC-type phosphate/phosphonate transport system permease subunit
LRLAPPALTPAARRKRLPSPHAVRRRYKLAQWASVALGGLAAAVVIKTALANLTARQLVPDQVFYALALLVLVVGLGVPWLVVEVLWLWKRRRHGWGR